MFPAITCNYVMYCRNRYAVFFCQLLQRINSRFIGFSNAFNGIVSELAQRFLGANRNTGLSNKILRVVFLPSNSSNDSLNSLTSYAVLFSQLVMKVFSSCIISSNVIHLFPCQFCVTRFFASRASSFFNHIFLVVRNCPKPKVRWIHTIASVSVRAIMQYFKSVWDDAFMQQPTDVMSQNAFVSRFTHSAVTVMCFGACPNPTRVSLGDIFPKPNFGCVIASFRCQSRVVAKRPRIARIVFFGNSDRIGLHRSVRLIFATPPVAQTTRGHSCLYA